MDTKLHTQQAHAGTTDEPSDGDGAAAAAAREKAGKLVAAAAGIVAQVISADPAKYLKANTQKGGE